MPVEISLDFLPVGYAPPSSGEGRPMEIALDGFYSSEDGDLFLRMLEGLPDALVRSLPLDMRTIPSNINHLLAVFRKGKPASVHVNEVLFLTEVDVKGGGEKAAGLREEDIAAVKRMVPEGIEIGEEEGLLVLFSAGWRKALYFDFGPLWRSGGRRHDPAATLGRVYSHLLHQIRFPITDGHFRRMTARNWFPYACFDAGLFEALDEACRRPEGADRLTDRIRRFVGNRLETLEAECLQAARTGEWERSVREIFFRYRSGDDRGSLAAGLACVEPILRAHRCRSEPLDGSRSLRLLCDADPETHGEWIGCSDRLPARFARFLAEVTMPAWKAAAPDAAETVGDAVRGKADEDRRLRKDALNGILCLHQLAFFLSEGSEAEGGGGTAHRAAAEIRSDNPREEGTAMATPTILLVDDEVSFVETMTKRLTKRGLQVLGAYSGEECMDILKRGEAVDVVVLDVKMPGMDGIETLQAVKRFDPSVEVILLTGHATVPSGIEGMKLGAYDYLMKPCDIEELFAKVDGASKKRQAHEEMQYDWERFMESGTLRELMVPLESYATVSEEASVFEAICALEEAQNAFNPKRYRHRAILVLDKDRRVVGKLNQHDIIQALEPQYQRSKERSERVLGHFGFGSTFIDAVTQQHGIWDDPLQNLYAKTFEHNVREFMHVPTEEETIDVSANLSEIVHRLIVGKYQSLLVRDGERIVGVVRLTDVFELLHIRLKAMNLASQIDARTGKDREPESRAG